MARKGKKLIKFEKFKRVARTRKIKCGEPCKNHKFIFSQVVKGCRRTCTGCGNHITECTNMDPTPSNHSAYLSTPPKQLHTYEILSNRFRD